MKIWLYLSILLACPLLHAQSVSVTGRLVDADDHKPLDGVTVSLTPSSSATPVAGSVSDSSGAFRIENLPSGTYVIKTQYLGYQSLTRTVAIGTADVNLGNVALQKEITTLKETTVTGTALPAQQKGDTTQYNANAFKAHPDATAEELVNKMPGVTNDANGLKVHGEAVQQVLVDGKPFFGDDPSATLRNLPADVVDKIQIFDQASEQSRFTGFDDGNAKKSINVITKANRRNGKFGRAYVGYGTDNRYIASVTFNTFKGNRRITLLGLSNNINQQNFSLQDLSGMMNSRGGVGGMGMMGRMGGGGGGGNSSVMNRMLMGSDLGNFLVGQQPGIATTHAAGLNYSNEWKKLKLSGSYFFNYTDNGKQSNLQRTYFAANDSDLIYHETSNSENKNLSNRANMRLEYNIDTMNTVVLTPRVNFQKLNMTSNTNAFTQIDSSEQAGSTRTTNTAAYNAYTASASLDFRHRFMKRGRTLSFNVSGDANDKTGTNDLQSIITTDTLFTDTLKQNSHLHTNGHTVSGTVAYTEPVARHGQLLFTYTPSQTVNMSDKTTYDMTPNGEQQTMDTALTNRFSNTFTYHRGGVAYQYNNDPWNFTLETNYQHAQLEGNETYPIESRVSRGFQAVLPQATFNYKFSKTSNLRVAYRTSMNPPSVTQLQNVVDNTNPLLISTGNPNLRPDYTHNTWLRFGKTNLQKNTGLFVMGNVSFIEHYIGNQTIHAQHDTVIDGIVLARAAQLTRPTNFNNAVNGRSFVTYTLALTKIKCNLSTFMGFTFSNTPTLANASLNRASQYGFNPGIALNSNFSENMDFTLSYNPSYNLLQNSLPSQPNNRYFSHTASARVNWILLQRIVLNTQVSQQHYDNISSDYKQDYTLWNAAVAYKLLKDKSLEARLSVFDLLNQNNNITHTQTESYVEDSNTLALRRYYMFTLTYTLKAFGQSDAKPMFPGMPPPGH